MKTEVFLEVRSMNDNDQAPWVVVTSDEYKRHFVLIDNENQQPKKFDSREDAEAQRDRIANNEADPEPPSGCFFNNGLCSSFR